MKTIFISLLFAFQFNISFAQQSTDTILFFYYKTNEWQLDSAKINLLEKCLPTIIEVKKIEAFTDSVGSTKSNYQLSINRGNAVANYFKKYQLNQALQPIYFGEQHKMDSALSNNRRVDIYCSIHQKVEIKNEIIPKLNQPELTTKDSVILILENIYFEADRALIIESSKQYLKSLVDQLKIYNAKTIEIIGHSNRGTTFYYWLSEQRAKTIFDFLITKGFDGNSMSYIGYGNSRKKINNPKSEEEMRKNMRVELILKF